MDFQRLIGNPEWAKHRVYVVGEYALHPEIERCDVVTRMRPVEIV